MSPLILNELRLLSSACFDSQSLLCVVLSGDARLFDKLRREELLACLDHLLKSASNASLMTKELRHTLVDHAASNYRIFVSMAGEMLMSAAQHEITTLDEKLYLQVFARPDAPTSRRGATRN
jgi:general secretion pathway protein A